MRVGRGALDSYEENLHLQLLVLRLSLLCPFFLSAF